MVTTKYTYARNSRLRCPPVAVVAAVEAYEATLRRVAGTNVIIESSMSGEINGGMSIS